MKLSELQRALESHVDRDPPSASPSGMESDLAMLDAVVVGIATAIVEHNGLVLPSSLSAISAANVEIEWFAENSPTDANAFLDSLLGLSQLVEAWIVQNTAQ